MGEVRRPMSRSRSVQTAIKAPWASAGSRRAAASSWAGPPLLCYMPSAVCCAWEGFAQ